MDAFVAKVNAAGTALIYAGFLGGTGNDRGKAIAVDSVGNAYIAGDTTSTQSSFPVTVGPDLTQNGGTDAFVAKVNASGTALSYAGFIGGSGSDQGNAIAVDSSNRAYVAGATNSLGTSFPDGDGFGVLASFDSTESGISMALLSGWRPMVQHWNTPVTSVDPASIKSSESLWMARPRPI